MYYILFLLFSFNLLYFYAIGFLENRSSDSIRESIAKDFLPIMILNYKVWPLINIINFKFMPPHLRVLFGNVISIFWTAAVIYFTQSK